MTRPRIHPTFTPSGSLAGLLADDLSLIQYPASDLEAGPQQVWLRRRGSDGVAARPLTGPASGARIAEVDGGVSLAGSADGLEWRLWWEQPADGVFGWSLEVRNPGTEGAEIDAVYLLDAALTPPADLARNEFYVSQYLDVAPLGSAEDFAVAVRQNMPGSGNPWLAVTCTEPVAGWCTDALQLRADRPGTGLDLTRDLPSERLQHEHTLVGLQTSPVSLAAGQSWRVSFRVVVEASHPAASTDADLALIAAALGGAGWAGAAPSVEGSRVAESTVFSPVSWAHGEDIGRDEFLSLAGPAEAIEDGPDGDAWAYWSGTRHVVAGAKDRAVLRPHGHVLRAAEGVRPQDVATASTAWMAGTFVSQLTRGHSCAEPLVSVRRSYLGLTVAEGVRVFVRDADAWQLLGLPSAWAVDDHTATWWYRRGSRMIRIGTDLSLASLTLDVEVDGEALDVLLSIRRPDGDLQVHEHHAVDRVTHEFPLGDADASAAEPLALPSLTTSDASGEVLARMLPSLAGNALIHYQVPRGLEQFTGGAWGTRDVCQGPVGLLAAVDRQDVVREVLLTVFAGQQVDGDWPQWFDYLSTHAAPGYRDSHGDIVYWPLLALGEYLEVTGDVGILDEQVRWVGEAEFAAPSTVLEHVQAAVDHLLAHRSADPRLPAYGHGDWNDALQPARPELAAEMVSTWTAELEIKALTTLACGLRTVNRELAELLNETADRTEAALRDRLLVDGELCGYAIVTDGGVEPLVHPRDGRTNLEHGSLQMIHALADELLTPEEAKAHLAIIDAELDGPTGIYLFDRPVSYHGGETHTFLRAEAASFWGREIGLMYMHAHVRWVEALLRLGLADRAWAAFQRILPEGLRASVTGVVPMQSNCYFSSVDALFADRDEAQREAGRLFDAEAPFAGGWRVYSSGPGLVLRMVVENLLGLRWTHRGLDVDPVLPVSLNGLTAEVSLGGRRVRATYTVRGEGHGVGGVTVNGQEVDVVALPRRYRRGGVTIPREAWDAAAAAGADVVEVAITVG